MITAELFERERPRLFGLAYRMTGSVADADDVVQDTWLRSQGESAAAVERPAAWLTTVTSRLAIDRLRAAQRRREEYVGPWLPEPILTDRDPAHRVELDETVTLGFLHVLERLGPVERAVFLLREVFDVGYEEIAAIVGRSEDACRQTAHRARERVRAERPRFAVEPARRRALVEAFMVAVSSGDAASLERLLHDDVAMLSDGGAGRHAARRPVRGPSRVARLMVNLAKRLHAESVVDVVEANGELAVLVSRDDQPELLVEFEFDAGQLRRIHTVVNPDKLAAVLAAASPLQ